MITLKPVMKNIIRITRHIYVIRWVDARAARSVVVVVVVTVVDDAPTFIERAFAAGPDGWGKQLHEFQSR